MRALVFLSLAACSAPVEDCHVTRGEWTQRSSDRVALFTASPECASGFCLVDRPDASVGTCIQRCEPACPAGKRCVQVDQDRLCLP